MYMGTHTPTNGVPLLVFPLFLCFSSANCIHRMLLDTSGTFPGPLDSCEACGRGRDGFEEDTTTQSVLGTIQRARRTLSSADDKAGAPVASASSVSHHPRFQFVSDGGGPIRHVVRGTPGGVIAAGRIMTTAHHRPHRQFPVVLPANSIPTSPSNLPFMEARTIALNTFWEIKGSIVHRQAFLAALVGRGGQDAEHYSINSTSSSVHAQLCALYGGQKPSALLFAILANGALCLDPSTGYSEAEKYRIAKSWTQQSVNLLLAGRGGSAGSDPASASCSLMSDLEAIQTVVILFDVFMPTGLVAKAVSLWTWGVRLLSHLSVQGPAPGTGPLDNPQPAQSIQEWLYRDIILRCHWAMAAVDVDRAYYTRSEPLINFFPRSAARINLPWHDIYFLDSSPVNAFLTMQAHLHTAPAGVDLRVFARTPNAETAMLMSKMFIEALFKFRSGVFGSLAFLSFLVMLTDRLSKFAEKRGIRALEVIAKSTLVEGVPTLLSTCSDKEKYFMDRVHLIDHFVLGCFHALPHGIGQKIMQGDPDAFFTQAPNYFCDKTHAHYLGAVLLSVLSKMIQNRFHAAGNPNPLALFVSPEFGKVLEIAAIFTNMLRAQLRYNPQLDGVAYLSAIPLLRTGALQIVLLSGLPQGAPERALLAADLATTVQYYAVGARRMGPAALQNAANFAAAAASVGVFVNTSGVAGSGLASIEEEEEDEDMVAKNEMGNIKVDTDRDETNAATTGSENVQQQQQQQPGLGEVVLSVDEMARAWYVS